MTFRQFKGLMNTEEEVKAMLKRGEAIPLHMINTYKNKNQIDERNFITLRVFSKQFKNKMKHHELEREA